MGSTKYRVGSILFDGERWWYHGIGKMLDQGMAYPVPGQMNIGTDNIKDLTFLIKHELEFAEEHVKECYKRVEYNERTEDSDG